MRPAPALLPASLLGGLLLLSACAGNTWVDRQPSATGEPNKAYVPVDEGGMDRPSNATIRQMGRLSDKALSVKGRARSVGVLPFVNLDKRAGGPWVSQLGVRMADFVAREMRQKDEEVEVLDSSALMARAAQVGSSRATLSTLPRVAKEGARLGCDLLVYGTLKVEKDVRQVDRDEMTIQAHAFDFLQGKLVSEVSYVISSRTEGTRWEWSLVTQESAWQPDSGFQVGETRSTLADELEVAASLLAKRLAPSLEKAAKGIRVEVLDSSSFVQAIAHLAAAEKSYQDLYDARVQASASNPFEVEGKVVLGKTEFSNLQAAKAHLDRLRAGLGGSTAVRFGQGFSSALSGRIRSEVVGKELSLADPTLGDRLDRAALKAQGLDLQVLPRLEGIGKGYAIRCEVLDLGTGRFVDAVRHPIPTRFSAELASMLGEKVLTPIGGLQELPKVQESTWAEIYKRSVRSVVQILSRKGSGSGFLVDKRGLILTNAHVIQGITDADQPHVLFQSGKRVRFKVLKVDEPWDLALLEIGEVPASAESLVLAEAGTAPVGTPVAVLGFPKNTGGWVMTPGYLSSVTERSKRAGTIVERYMYTSPTRAGSSGSPVLLQNGTVLAVHCAGAIGSLQDSSQRTELTGFAYGVPGSRARQFLSSAR